MKNTQKYTFTYTTNIHTQFGEILKFEKLTSSMDTRQIGANIYHENSKPKIYVDLLKDIIVLYFIFFNNNFEIPLILGLQSRLTTVYR